jgi:hypothetical protein
MPMRWSLATLAAPVAVAILAGCTSTEEALIERGLPPAYAAGYDDGCASGKAAGGDLFSEAEKDESRYASDRQYAEGWDEGFAKCKRDLDAMVFEARTRNPSAEK